MGGKSESRIQLNEEGIASWTGTLRVEGGGFCGLRTRVRLDGDPGQQCFLSIRDVVLSRRADVGSAALPHLEQTPHAGSSATSPSSSCAVQ